MRIGLVVPSIGNFGKKGFYNAQEIGLAKELDVIFDEVKVYRLVPFKQGGNTESIQGCKNAFYIKVPAKKIGSNGIIDVNCLDSTLDALVCFSDTQIALPSLYKWALNKGVKFIPYIGVVESHSTSQLNRIIVDWLFGRNLSVYKKCHCLVKTPKVGSDLKKLGVRQVTVAPVGLDLSLLRKDYADYSKVKLKSKYGYDADVKVLLFIGRLIDEKQPVKMIDIFAVLANQDEQYRLLMIGTGELKGTVVSAIQKHGIQEKVQLIDQIQNSDIWELYRIADTFVNLNQQEIFGMAILESMYYGCKVVAWKSPGPNFIIEHGKSGWLVDNNPRVIESVLDNTDVATQAHERIETEFSWSKTAQMIVELVGEK